MRAGDSVRYVPKRGKPKPAVVLRHTGSGPSGYKTLDLSVGKNAKNDVPHRIDADGGAHWILDSEHAAGHESKSTDSSASVVPEAKATGRATAGVGDASED